MKWLSFTLGKGSFTWEWEHGKVDSNGATLKIIINISKAVDHRKRSSTIILTLGLKVSKYVKSDRMEEGHALVIRLTNDSNSIWFQSPLNPIVRQWKEKICGRQHSCLLGVGISVITKSEKCLLEMTVS